MIRPLLRNLIPLFLLIAAAWLGALITLFMMNTSWMW